MVSEKETGERDIVRIDFVLLLPVDRWVGEWVPSLPLWVMSFDVIDSFFVGKFSVWFLGKRRGKGVWLGLVLCFYYLWIGGWGCLV